MMNPQRRFLTLLLIGLLIAGCGRAAPALPAARPAASSTVTSQAPAPAAPSPTQAQVAGLSPDEVATLDSLEQVDGYPLYTMHYFGPYQRLLLRLNPFAGFLAATERRSSPAWACSLFAALGDPDNQLYGRNFDWKFSPALLLFTDPPDGYASVSMVDIAYLGFGGDNAPLAADLPLSERRALLAAPYLPFDGMNEQGLAMGMAAVPPGDMRPDPAKVTIGSLEVMREMLDHARDVDEAVVLLKRYNLKMQGGTAIHYLLADRSGRASLVEYSRGEMHVFPNQGPWHLATNFLRPAEGTAPAGQCWRYDAIGQQLTATQGRMTAAQALDLLEQVAQPGTQWSVVYQMSTGAIDVVMGQHYGDPHSFSLWR